MSGDSSRGLVLRSLFVDEPVRVTRPGPYGDGDDYLDVGVAGGAEGHGMMKRTAGRSGLRLRREGRERHHTRLRSDALFVMMSVAPERASGAAWGPDAATKTCTAARD